MSGLSGSALAGNTICSGFMLKTCQGRGRSSAQGPAQAAALPESPSALGKRPGGTTLAAEDPRRPLGRSQSPRAAQGQPGALRSKAPPDARNSDALTTPHVPGLSL